MSRGEGMGTKGLIAAGALFACLATGGQLLAHHAFGGEFDANKPVLLKGKVTRVEWVNPHAWIHVEVVKPDGTKEEWMVEGEPRTRCCGAGSPKTRSCRAPRLS